MRYSLQGPLSVMSFGLAGVVRSLAAVPSPPNGEMVDWGRSGDPIRMTVERRERLTPEHRLTSPLHHEAVRESGRPFRGRLCVMLVLSRPGESTRFGFVASRKAVGGAVERNRARRRLRELVRRRWPRLDERGYWILFVALRGAVTASQQELATEVEHLLARAGALAPIHAAEVRGHA